MAHNTQHANRAAQEAWTAGHYWPTHNTIHMPAGLVWGCKCSCPAHSAVRYPQTAAATLLCLPCRESIHWLSLPKCRLPTESSLAFQALSPA